MPPTRNARGLATARKIEAAAVRLAADRGLDGLTVDVICAEVGVGQRTFFHHYPTKEDALLGLDLPVLDEERVRTYLSDPTIGVLSGAVSLVRLPTTRPEDAELLPLRVRLITTSPALMQRQTERLTPLLHEVRGLVHMRLRTMAAQDGQHDEATLAFQAELVTAIGAALMQTLGIRALEEGVPMTPEAPNDMLEALTPIWDRLL